MAPSKEDRGITPERWEQMCNEFVAYVVAISNIDRMSISERATPAIKEQRLAFHKLAADLLVVLTRPF